MFRWRIPPPPADRPLLTTLLRLALYSPAERKEEEMGLEENAERERERERESTEFVTAASN